MLVRGPNHSDRSWGRGQRRRAVLPVLWVWVSTPGLSVGWALAGCDRYPLPDGFPDDVNVAHHAADYADGAVHGSDVKQGKADCRTCHGPDLAGMHGVRGCDGCHQAGWRTQCSFCHGGTDNGSGAPPPDLLGNMATTFLGVGSHTEHGSPTTHPAYPCTTCHAAVADVLTPGHLFDATPRWAEVVLSGGLSPAGQYAAPGCKNLYCHGSGRTDGAAASFVPATALGCQSCHPTAGLSLPHSHHPALGCQTCHSTVAGNSLAIKNPDLHVDGVRQVSLEVGTWNGATRTCSGTGGPCHTGDVAW
jgi:predicted CxxxxCH...CXXCH cytochrome family protein